MDELYILAREVLLDALEVLEQHRHAIILVGAQAIYLHVGDADLAVAPYTTDGDLALNPQLLGHDPALEQLLTTAGFAPKASDSVGVWITHRSILNNPSVDIAIDLLVPKSVSPGTGRRSANLDGHSNKAARIVSGLEGALVDNEEKVLKSLHPNSSRQISVAVAGPAALLVAKVHKIQDRATSTRANDKDALDVFRLLRGISSEDLAARFNTMIHDSRSQAVVQAGISLLRQQFGSKNTVGTRMVVRSLLGLMDENEVAMSCELLTQDLLKIIER